MVEIILAFIGFLIIVNLVDYYYIKVGDLYIKDFFVYRVVKKQGIFSTLELMREGLEEGTGHKSSHTNVWIAMTYQKIDENFPKTFWKFKN